jgi:hypothetical protein
MSTTSDPQATNQTAPPWLQALDTLAGRARLNVHRTMPQNGYGTTLRANRMASLSRAVSQVSLATAPRLPKTMASMFLIRTT